MKIGRLGGGGSDYAAFVQHIGVPSVDMSFGKGNKNISVIKITIALSRRAGAYIVFMSAFCICSAKNKKYNFYVKSNKKREQVKQLTSA